MGDPEERKYLSWLFMVEVVVLLVIVMVVVVYVMLLAFVVELVAVLSILVTSRNSLFEL